MANAGVGTKASAKHYASMHTKRVGGGRDGGDRKGIAQIRIDKRGRAGSQRGRQAEKLIGR